MAWLEDSLKSDAEAWTHEFRVARDVSNLKTERNVFRYHPVPVTIRFEEATSGHGTAELLRVVAAGLTAWSGHAPKEGLVVSTATPLPPAIAQTLQKAGVVVATENHEGWKIRISALASQSGPNASARIRLIGGNASATAQLTGGKPDIAIYANNVVTSGRVELLTFLREQAVSITAHRFGTPNNLSDNLI